MSIFFSLFSICEIYYTLSDNCAKFILKLAKEQDVTINLRHIMDFGKAKFTAKVLNDGAVVHNMDELLFEAAKYV